MGVQHFRSRAGRARDGCDLEGHCQLDLHSPILQDIAKAGAGRDVCGRGCCCEVAQEHGAVAGCKKDTAGSSGRQAAAGWVVCEAALGGLEL